MTILGKYLVIERHDLENFASTTFTHKEPAIEDARKLAGPSNRDYVIIRVVGIMQTLVETKLSEASER